MKTCRIDQVVDVGKQQALQWIADGSARPERPQKPPKPMPPRPDYLSRPSQLLLAVRAFWFGNVAGTFDLDGRPVRREEIHLHGGPSPEFNDCDTCQKAEWLSRLNGRNHYRKHSCPTGQRCHILCSYQGDDAFTHYHQNFGYAARVDMTLNAAKCAMFQPAKGIKFIWSHHCDQSVHVFLRQFAQACQFDVVGFGEKIEPSRYNFAFVVMGPTKAEIPPGLPIVMYGHDLWKQPSDRQALIDHVRPDVFWTPFLSSWKAHYRFPAKTRLVFRPVPASQFFTRPNLDKKSLDVLCIGCTGNPIYDPRLQLSRQLAILASKWRIKLHHPGGARRAKHIGSVRSDKIPYCNAWSELLGSARYVAFDGIRQEPQPVFYKYYEVLGSGAVPIMPQAPDLKLLGIEPWVHYIPVSEIRGNNKRMVDLLEHYNEHKHIAEAAVSWHKENADRLLFEGIGDLVRDITGHAYPRRLR